MPWAGALSAIVLVLGIAQVPAIIVTLPAILIGALGGMAARGILGMFTGATLLALGYQIFMNWVETNPDSSTASLLNNTSSED